MKKNFNKVINIFALASLMSVPGIAQGQGPEIPDFNDSFQKPLDGFGGPLKFDPHLEVNTNRGSLKTRIVLALPPNLSGFESLVLNYNSNQWQNFGLGVGWSWNLPKISENPGTRSRDKYFVATESEVSDLRQTHEVLNEQLISQIKSYFSMGLGQLPARLSAYRPVIDESGTLWVLGTLESGGPLGWMGLELDGGRIILDAKGRIRLVGKLSPELKKSSLIFTWESGLLQKIEPLNQGWSLTARYEGQQNQLKFIEGEFLTLPLAAKELIIQKGGARRSLVFSSQRGLITKAGFKGEDSRFPIFQAAYQNVNQEMSILRSEANPFTRHDDKSTFTLAENFNFERSAGPEGGLHNLPGYYYLDLNNDGHTDRIQSHFQTEFSGLKETLSRFKEKEIYFNKDGKKYVAKVKNASAAEIQAALDQIQPQFGVPQMARRNYVTERSEWVSEPSLGLPAGVSPTRYVAEEIGIFEYSKQAATHIEVIPNGNFFVDVNGDGLSDLITCTGSQVAGRLSSEIENDPVGDKKRSHNIYNLAYAYGAGLGVVGQNGFPTIKHVTEGPLADPTPFLNEVLDDVGPKGRLFVQVIDFEKLDSQQAQIKEKLSKGGTAGNHIAGVSGWRELNVNFNCHGGTLINDFNGDGYLDLLTGKNLQFFGDNFTPGPSQKIENLSTVIVSGSQPLDWTDTSLSAMGLGMDGKITLLNSRGVFFNRATGETQIVKNGITETIQKSPREPLIEKFISVWGGEKRIVWEFKNGLWVVAKEETDPKTPGQLSYTQKFSYFGGLFNPLFGQFVGFLKTQQTNETIDPEAHEAASVVEKIYSEDSSANSHLLRDWSRLDARLRARNLRAAENQVLLKREVYDWTGLRLSQKRVRPYISKHSEKIFTDGKGENYAQSKIVLRGLWDKDLWARDSNGGLLVPLTQFTRREGHGLYSDHTDQGLDQVDTEKQTYQFMEDIYVLRISKSENLGKEDKPTASPWVATYYSWGALEKLCQEKRCATRVYDSLGRLSEISKSQGFWQNAKYNDESVRPSEISNADGTQVLKFDEITGKLLEYKNNLGAKQIFTFTSDGILSTLQSLENRAGSKWVTNFDSNLVQIKKCDLESTSPCIIADGQIEVIKQGEWTRFYFDGMGRIVDIAQKDSDSSQVRRSGKSIFGRYGKPVKNLAPHFENQNPKGAGVIFEQFTDALGRPIRILREGGKLEEIKNYDGDQTVSLTNGVLESGECRSSLGGLLCQWLGNEKIHFETDGDGKITKAVNLGIEWKYSGYGEEIASTSNPAQSHDFQRSNPFYHQAPQWDQTRSFEETPEGMVKIEGIFKTQFDSIGRPKSFGLAMSNRPGLGNLVLQEERFNFSNGLLKGREVYSSSKYIKTDWKAFFGYNSLGGMTAWRSPLLDVEFERDEFNRVKLEKIKINSTQKQIEVSRSYNQGQIQSLNPWIDKFVRDERGIVEEVQYKNGLKSELKRENSGLRVSEISYSNNSNLLWNRSIDRNSQTLLTIDQKTLSQLSKVSGNPTVRLLDVAKDYLAPNFHLSAPRGRDAGVVRDVSGRVVEIRDFASEQSKNVIKLEWTDKNLSKIHLPGDYKTKVSVNVIYDSSGSLFKICRVRMGKTDECMTRESSDFFDSPLGAVIRIQNEGQTLGVLVGDVFFPAIIDQLGSLIGLFDPTGKHILFEREYSVWGQKTVHFGAHYGKEGKGNLRLNDALENTSARDLEKYIPWGFAQLLEFGFAFENPGTGKEDPLAQIFWSQTRAYLPFAGEWLSPDHAVIWNPAKIAAFTGNWHAVRYAGNQPLDSVDPSGELAPLALGAIMVGVSAGLSFVAARQSGKSVKEAAIAAGKSGLITAATAPIGGRLVVAIAARAGAAAGISAGFQMATKGQIDLGETALDAGLGAPGGMIAGNTVGKTAIEKVALSTVSSLNSSILGMAIPTESSGTSQSNPSNSSDSGSHYSEPKGTGEGGIHDSDPDGANVLDFTNDPVDPITPSN